MAIQFSKIKALFLDLDGVVWHGADPIGDLSAIFRKIAKMDVLPLIGTNNATKTPEAYCEKFAGFGVNSMKPEYIFSPAIGAASLFREKYPADVKIHVVGSDALRAYLRNAGFALVPDGADIVLASLDRELTYDKIAVAQRQILNGAEFYATNRDPILLSEDGIKPGGGVIVNAIETCSGIAPAVIGKPEPYLIRAAMRAFGLTNGEILAIGDRYDTDILGGLNAGCPTALVLSGVETRESIAKFDREPDLICADLNEAIDRLYAEKTGESVYPAA